MRVLVISQYFTPEVTAARTRLHAFAKGLAESGHDVEVVSEVPNHPEGVVRPEFRRRAIVRREMDGFRVNYVWVHASPRKTFLNRLLFYGSYAGMAAAVGSALRRPDVVLASSPPLPAGAAAAMVAARHRVPWVLDVRDLWPDAAVILGELRDPRAIRAAQRMERWLYRSAAGIATTTEPFRKRIRERSGGAREIELIPNGTTRQWLEAGEAEVGRSEFDLPEDRFVWLYAGNLGIAQGLETAIEAAGDLGGGFQLVLLGDGPVRSELEAAAARVPEGSVVFRTPVQPEVAARYTRAADALLVPLADQQQLEEFVPSKLFDCCAVGRPVILAARGEAPRLAGEANAALAVPPGNAPALAQAVRRLRDEPDLAAGLSEAGRAFASRYLRERGITTLEELLERVARAGR